MRIILADDHVLFREGLKLLLTSKPDMYVVAEIDNLSRVIEAVAVHDADLLILDYHMPGGESSAILSYCKQRYENLKVIALTGSKSGLILKQLQDANADAVLLKDSSAEELLTAIAQVSCGKKFISDSVQEHISKAQIDLTSRELQILQLIYQGISTTDIAQQLNLSPKTADKHRENIMRKLQVNNAVQLIHKVQQLQLLSHSDSRNYS